MRLPPPMRRTAVAIALLTGITSAIAVLFAMSSVQVAALDTGAPVLIVGDPLDFGTAIPGATYTDDLTVCINDSVPGDQVDYGLLLLEEPLATGSGSVPDIRPFVEIARDPSEPDAEADLLTGATVTHFDQCDRWLVVLTAPHCEGAYNAGTDPAGPGPTIPCQVERPTPDPQTWREGSDLAAQIEITADPQAVAGAAQAPVALPSTGGEPP
jgi:hypothetical protein